MHRRKFLIGPNESEGSVVTAEFTDEEWSVLSDFHSFAEELLQTELVTNGVSYQIGLSFTASGTPAAGVEENEAASANGSEGGVNTSVVRDEIAMALKVGDGPPIRRTGVLRVTSRVPPRDQMRVALHLLRPMLLQRERTYLLKVCNILARRVEHADVRDHIKSLRDLFSGRVASSGYYLVVGSDENPNGLMVNTKEVFVTSCSPETRSPHFMRLPGGNTEAIHRAVHDIGSGPTEVRSQRIRSADHPGLDDSFPDGNESRTHGRPS